MEVYYDGIIGTGSGNRNGFDPLYGRMDSIIRRTYVFYVLSSPEKEQAKRDALMSDLAVNDYVLTSSGFYGVIIDITDDTVIVEFGNNKNCRIPMKKSAIQEVEKPGAE